MISSVCDDGRRNLVADDDLAVARRNHRRHRRGARRAGHRHARQGTEAEQAQAAAASRRQRARRRRADGHRHGRAGRHADRRAQADDLAGRVDDLDDVVAGLERAERELTGLVARRRAGELTGVRIAHVHPEIRQRSLVRALGHAIQRHPGPVRKPRPNPTSPAPPPTPLQSSSA